MIQALVMNGAWAQDLHDGVPSLCSRIIVSVIANGPGPMGGWPLGAGGQPAN